MDRGNSGDKGVMNRWLLTVLLGLLLLLIWILLPAYADIGISNSEPEDGIEWGVPFVINVEPTPDPPIPLPQKPSYASEYDTDSDRKGGGKDPYVIRNTWNYFDFDAYKCSNAPNSFDYDNDGFPEHMCYWYGSSSQILFNDKYDGVLKDGTNFTGEINSLWMDHNENVFIDEGELLPFSEDPRLVIIHSFPDGRIIDNGRYIYCIGESITYGFEFECTQPTYWETQEWMNEK